MKKVLNIKKESSLQFESLFLLSSVILYIFIPPVSLVTSGWLMYKFRTDEFEKVFKLQIWAIFFHIILLGTLFFMKFYDTPKVLSSTLFFANGIVYIFNIFITYFVIKKSFIKV